MKTTLLSVVAVVLVGATGGMASAQKTVVHHTTVAQTKVVHSAVVHTPVHTPVIHTPVVQVKHTPVIHTPVVHTAHVVPAAFRNWHVTHGVRFSHGVFFRGNEFRFFHHRHWNSQYRCWTFYYPDMNCYYYWSAANGCFYPISYAPVVAPNGTLPDGVNTLPDDATALPPDDGSILQ